MSEGKVSVAALMPHAPVLVPVVGGKHGNRASASVRAMVAAARRIVAAQPDAVVLISPHTPRRRCAFALWAGGRIRGSLAQFGAPEAAVDLPAAEKLAATITAEARARGVELWPLRSAELDHGAVVPLWHLAEAGWRGPTLVLGLNYPGEPGLVELGEAIAAAAGQLELRLGIVASGDMSHCLQPGAPAGFHPRAQEFDSTFIEHLRAGRYRALLELDADLQSLAAEDAVDATVVAAAAVQWDATGHEVLSYEGPFGVGYGVAILHEGRRKHPAAWDRDESAGQIELPQIARSSIAAAFGAAVEKPAAAAAGFLAERHGVFVTLRDLSGRLRGCVGTLTPRCRDTVEETWRVARDAAFRDGRFPPVSPEELPDLHFEVSVMFPPEEVASGAELDPQRFGVVVTAADGRRGVLLPDVAGVETVAQQLALARRKGGIGEFEPVRLRRFAVKKFCEPDPKPSCS
jgi:MEMO1 family protein